MPSVSRLATVARLAGAIALAGLLLAGLMLPYVGGAGLVARDGAQVVADIPAEFTDQQPGGVTRILAADGSLISNIYTEYRMPVGIDQIPAVMQAAIVSIEDSRFYQHHGVDTTGTLRAMIENITTGGIAQGGSTLTQQLVKNTLLYDATTDTERQAATAPTLGRKLHEAKIALALEKKYSKAEILDKYLNLMNFGAGAYGVQAASDIYFSTTVDKLTLPQVALLAGLVQNPTGYNPLHNPKAATDRRNVVLAAMVRYGYLTAAQGTQAEQAPLGLRPGTKPAQSCVTAAGYSGFFCDYLTSYLTGTLGIPKQLLDIGGLTITTTLDPAMQNAATQALIDQPDFAMGAGKAATMDIVQPGTGKVRALAVNRMFGSAPDDPARTTVNLPVVASAGVGSTYKAFTAAAALAAGYPPTYTLSPGNSYTSKIEAAKGIAYTVGNAGVYPESLPMNDALYMSMNTYFVNLEDVLGSVTPAVDMAERMGLWAADDPLPATIIAQDRASFTLGPEPTSPLRLATAYATIAAGGTRCEPTPVESIVDAAGKAPINPKTARPYVGAPGSNCTANAIPASIANTLTQMLTRDVMPGNPAQTAARAYLGDGRQIAGKTGTTQNNFSYAFVGFTPQLVGSVIAYNPTSQEVMPNIGGGEGGFGGGYPAQIWHDAMLPIMAGLPHVAFPAA